ncbi:MAG: YifB family Mg chelatase-like AAA ATPase [Gammaproteobacteria bacterium]|nr:YifB family Mg chelatase-like AAA ATPase [Gammaproteobacteria bacterium]
MPSLAILHSRSFQGFNAPLVSVEAHISNSTLPRFSIVGLPETAVKESKDRVHSAIINSRFFFPYDRITINLAPADVPKEGGRFDLAIALSILIASNQIKAENVTDYEFAGELALSGELRRIQGALPFALATQQAGKKLIISRDSADEAALHPGLTVLPANNLLEVCAHLQKQTFLIPHTFTPATLTQDDETDLSDVKGHFQAKRALEIAAAGGHSVLMVGPPGTGKTMLAQRFPGLLPLLTHEEALEVAAIYSLSRQAASFHWRKRPFRMPHHTASYVALVGGNNPPIPGEVSLAHQGILFLDELGEFNAKTLETLREPLENGCINIARAGNTLHFPARFQLLAAMNPCPCGYANDHEIACKCTPDKIKRYQTRISGPLLDRIDIHLTLPRPSPHTLLDETIASGESSKAIRDRVEKTQQMQWTRQKKLNSQLSSHELLSQHPLSNALKQRLNMAITRFHFSPRSYCRLLKVARTLADLAGSPEIQLDHLEESLSFRHSP